MSHHKQSVDRIVQRKRPRVSKDHIHVYSERHPCPHPDCPKFIVVSFTDDPVTKDRSSQILAHDHTPFF